MRSLTAPALLSTLLYLIPSLTSYFDSSHLSPSGLLLFILQWSCERGLKDQGGRELSGCGTRQSQQHRGPWQLTKASTAQWYCTARTEGQAGYREVEGSCHTLSMKSGSSVNQSTWNRLVNYFPIPKHRPLLGATSHDLHQLHTAASLALCLKTLPACQNEKQFGEPGQGSWGQSLGFLLFPVSGCLQWLCLKSSVNPGVPFYLSVCFCL